MNTIVTIFQLIPAIVTALKTIEEAIPGQGQGEAKLAAVRSMLEAVDSGIAAVWPQISGIITALVTLFNTTGVFAKK